MPLLALGARSPSVPYDAWVAPGAQVIGDVALSPDASVWFNAVLRGDNESIRIGPRSNVQDGAVLHTDIGFPLTIGADCTVGHGAVLHGCTVEDGCLVGMGAIVLNGAVIGTGSLVGAGALVTEGKRFPPRSLLVGSPARAIRSLDDDAVARLLASAASYVRNWKRFRDGLTEA